MNPASTMKLVTTFAALELLGPDYWSYGLARNRNDLQTFLRYARAQGLWREPGATLEAAGKLRVDRQGGDHLVRIYQEGFEVVVGRRGTNRGEGNSIAHKGTAAACAGSRR